MSIIASQLVENEPSPPTGPAFRITIKLVNKTGRHSNYSVFCAVPPGIDGKAYSNILLSAKVTREETQTFVVKRLFKAICGYVQGQPGHLVESSVIQARPLDLGSSISFQAEGDDSPKFSQEVKSTGNAEALQITTGNGSSRDSTSFIGLSRAIGDRDEFSRALTIIPEDGRTYDIRPNNTFIIVAGEYRKGALVEPQAFSQPVEIDFDLLGWDEATLVHQPDGTWKLS